MDSLLIPLLPFSFEMQRKRERAEAEAAAQARAATTARGAQEAARKELTAAATTSAAFRAVLGAISADLPAPLSPATLDALLMRGVPTVQDDHSISGGGGVDAEFATALRSLHAAMREAVGAERDAAAAAAAEAATAPLVARLAERSPSRWRAGSRGRG